MDLYVITFDSRTRSWFSCETNIYCTVVGKVLKTISGYGTPTYSVYLFSHDIKDAYSQAHSKIEKFIGESITIPPYYVKPSMPIEECGSGRQIVIYKERKPPCGGF